MLRRTRVPVSMARSRSFCRSLVLFQANASFKFTPRHKKVPGTAAPLSRWLKPDLRPRFCDRRPRFFPAYSPDNAKINQRAQVGDNYDCPAARDRCILFRVLRCAVFPVGSVRFGVVNRTAPHRTVGFFPLENLTSLHRRFHEIGKPHRNAP